jgi:outer membrane lipoprotein carrier protein
MKWPLFTVIAAAALTAAIAAPTQAGLDARSTRLDSVLSRVQNHYRETNSFHAKFTEEVTSPGGMKKTRTGSVYYLKPGRMRWEFAAPDSETIVSDGTIVYSYEPDLNQVIETPVKQILKSPSATTFLLGFGDLRHDFKASFTPLAPKDGRIHLTLVPKEGGNQAEVALDAHTLDLVALQLTDAVGDRTSFRFTDWTDNPTLADALFKFEVPQGADIVRTPGA